MAQHPIRVVVEDDLQRSRLTVFFRLLLAIPHIVWLFLWTVGAVVVAVLNWFATLFLGRSPQWSHDFLSAYVRYWTHVWAYLYLAANPYPGFLGTPESYPVDVEVEPPARQRRLVTVFRLFLAVPALLLASALAGFGAPPGGGGGGGTTEDGGAAVWTSSLTGAGAVGFSVAFLAWFACLARGRMPAGFRDIVAWTLRYTAQTYGYLFLLTDRYPNSDPFEPRGVPPERTLAVSLDLGDDGRRSRVTVFFRLLLALPHLVWVTLWGYAVFLAVVGQWFFALAAGRPARPLHRFIGAWVRYQVQVYSYLLLAANPFPGFVGEPGYPVQAELDPPGPQRRLVTLFRLFLAVPAFVVAYVLSVAAFVAALLGWFASLVLGRMPEGLRNLNAYVVHYWSQVYAYAYLLSDRYPYSSPRSSAPFREAEPVPEPGPGPEPAAA